MEINPNKVVHYGESHGEEMAVQRNHEENFEFLDDLSAWALRYGHLIYQNGGQFTCEIAGTEKIKHCNKNMLHL